MNNTVAGILKVMSYVIFVGGLICGIIFASEAEEFSVALVWWVSSFISGMTLMGFAEIIEQLTLSNIKTDAMMSLLKKSVDSEKKDEKKERKIPQPVVSKNVNRDGEWTCKNCGRKNSQTSQICKDCGEYK